MIKFLTGLLGSSTGVSSKRFITLVSFLLIVIISIFDLFTIYTVNQFIFDGLMYLCSVGLGTIVAQNAFASRNKYLNNNNNHNNDYDNNYNNTNNFQQGI